MASDGYLAWTPLIGVLVWFTVSGHLVLTERYRTWTERFFLGICVCLGASALGDFIFFGLPLPSSPSDTLTATLVGSASLASITLVGLFLFLYGTTLFRRFHKGLLLALVPTAFLLYLFPTHMFAGFRLSGGTTGVLIPEYQEPWLLVWLGVTGTFWLVGLFGVMRTYLEVRRQSPRLANRIGAIVVGFVIALIAGATSNAVLALGGADVPPLFSTVLAVPGVLIFFAVTPTAVRGLNDAFLRRRASEYEVKAAFLTFYDGTLLGSKVVPEEEMIDADAFSATLDVIQNFMRTSFPTLRGKWLKSIHHGDYTLVMERGRFAYLTLIIAGTENDLLRRKMIESLQRLEERNATAFETWRGVVGEAVGIDEMLGALLSTS